MVSDNDDNTHDYSQHMITLFSMVSTIISILLSIFEFCLYSNFIKSKSQVMITFDINSSDIASMHRTQFRSKIEFQRNKLTHYICQLLNLSSSNLCERLKPKQNINGVTYTFIVDMVDESSVKHVSKVLRDAVVRANMAKVCAAYPRNTL